MLHFQRSFCRFHRRKSPIRQGPANGHRYSYLSTITVTQQVCALRLSLLIKTLHR